MANKKLSSFLTIFTFLMLLGLVWYFWDDSYILNLLKNNSTEAQVTYFIYVVASVVLISLPLIPLMPFVLAAFGPGQSIFITASGVFFGAMICFLISRKAGQTLVERIVGRENFDKYQNIANISSFKNFLLLRLISNNYFDIVSYIGGLSEVKLFSYVVATLISTIFWISLSFYALDKSAQFGANFTVLVLGSMYLLIGFVAAFFLKKIIASKVEKSTED